MGYPAVYLPKTLKCTQTFLLVTFHSYSALTRRKPCTDSYANLIVATYRSHPSNVSYSLRVQHCRFLQSKGVTLQISTIQGCNTADFYNPRVQHCRFLQSKGVTLQISTIQGCNTADFYNPRVQHCRFLQSKGVTLQISTIQGCNTADFYNPRV